MVKPKSVSGGPSTQLRAYHVPPDRDTGGGPAETGLSGRTRSSGGPLGCPLPPPGQIFEDSVSGSGVSLESRCRRKDRPAGKGLDLDFGATTRPSVLARAGDGDAGEFARIYSPLLYRMARKRGLDEHDAEDLMQQMMLELLRLLPRFQYDRSKGSFKGFLKKMTGNRVVDLYRKKKPLLDPEALENVVETEDASDEAFDREWQKAHLIAALDAIRPQVKPSTFQSFQLFALEGWPIERVAETLGLTRNQVSQNKRRVIQRLKAQVEEQERER